MGENTERRKINLRQKAYLVEYMKTNVRFARNELADGEISKHWDAFTIEANTLGPPEKTADKWTRVYKDIKLSINKKMRLEAASQRRTGGGPPEFHPLDSIESEINDILKGYSGPDINANIMEHGVAPTSGRTAESPSLPHAKPISIRNSASARHTIPSPQGNSSYQTASQSPTLSSIQTPRGRLSQSRSRSPHNLPERTARSTPIGARRNLTSTFNNVRLPSVSSPISSEPHSPRRLHNFSRGISQPDTPKLTAKDLDERMKRNERRYDRVLEYLAQIAQSSTDIARAITTIAQNFPKTCDREKK